ncbi:hypothetical protein [Flavobacterium suzhouense]|uniref:DUF3037 domain-containing protein n=1 Tax=Flavobacterium suzhouense TaxID=1529638 RepID=A0ABW5NNZ8_9FLAO
MKTFFSIIYIPLNPALKEKVSVGLIMSDGERDYFKISNSKLNVIKHLIPHQNFSILKTYFKSLSKDINQYFDDNDFKLITTKKSSNWINESYMSYLHRYANNLVLFSEIKSIDIKLDKISFKKIFEKYIFEFDEEEVHHRIFHLEETIKLDLYDKIENRVNIDTLISPRDFEELITPVEVGFIGRNGTIVAGQTVDFSKRLYNLENDLTKFISFTKAADYKQNQQKGKYFIVGEEPNKKEFPQNHRTWKNVKDSKLVDYVNSNEIEKIADYIEKKDVTPYFNKEASN